MKYIKSFNESLNDDEYYQVRDDIRNFAEERLVSLLDEGFQLKIYDAVSKNVAVGFTIWLYKGDFMSDELFKWEDIKDDYIPFLQIISRQYKLLEFSTDVVRFNLGNRHNSDMRDFSLQDVINDNVFQNYVESPDISNIGICLTPNEEHLDNLSFILNL